MNGETNRNQVAQRSQRPEPALLPPVDIAEDAWRHHPHRRPARRRPGRPLDRHRRPTLTLEAPLRLGEANSLVSVYAEVRANRYRRSFELSSELDTTGGRRQPEGRRADLRLPKLEQAKPRRIEVKVGT
jgi:hypothetical protein